ncbi:MAG: hypothetical protein JW814_11785 [Candidatus Krumholzibacteriota bacterium]|nr:hypothetical protein [Candidatus Krumholzibacteriota bacterium]
MKRITLLLLVTSFLTISASSALLASSPVISDKTASVSAMFSRHLVFFLRTLDKRYVHPGSVDNDREDPIVGGDADDLADGRIDPDDDDNISIVIPGVPTKKNIF